MRWTKTPSASCALAAAMIVSAVTVPAVAGAASASTIKVPAKYASGLRVAMDATYPPDEFVKTGTSTIIGFDADLNTALSKVLGVKITAINATFDTIIPGIQDGKYDIGNSSFTDTKSREKSVTFVDYYKAGEGFYENSANTKTFNGLKSLCGHSVAVETGTTEASDADTQKKSCKVNVLSFSNQNEVNLAVSSGRAEVGFADSQVAAYIVHLSHGQFKLTGTPFETAPYGFIVAKNSGLAQPLLAAVKAIMANGQYKKILDKWGVEQGAVSHPTINGATS